MIGQENHVSLLCRARSALPAAVSLLCLGILLLSCSSDKECTYDTDCPGNKSCIGGKCVTQYPLDCPDRECADGFLCIDDTCVESACIEVNCPEDEACAGGNCYPKDCELRSCPGLGEVCIDEDCLPADCMDIECPQGQRCAVGNCYPVDCETKNCPGYGEVCIDEECTQRTCVGVTCPEGQRCANGYCYPENCTEAGCFGEGEVCVDGVCRRISCLGVDCPEGYRCANGWCYPADCAGEDCSDFGEVCYEGKCVPADCAGVVCPAGQRCAHGECFPEKCEDLTCEADEVCYAGQCVNWNCVGNNCPAEHNCVDGECVQVHCPEPCTMDNQCNTADCGGVEMTCLFDMGLGSPAWGAQGQTCSDGDACTIDDTCDQGLCVGTGLVCDEPPADKCEVDVAVTYPSVGECQGGECLYQESRETCPGGCLDGHCEGDPCDGIVCDSHEHCESGDCVCDDGWADCQGATPGCETELWTLENCTGCGDACEDGNPCTTDVCDPAEGCKWNANDGAACGSWISYCSSASNCDTRQHKKYCVSGSCTGEWHGTTQDAGSGACNDRVCSSTDYCNGLYAWYTGKKCSSTEGSCSVGYGGGSCSACNNCSDGSCNVPTTTNWGAGGTGCSAANQRCYTGACKTCSSPGYLASDGCSGCAGQGGNVCWHFETVASKDCHYTCPSYGGCVDANWNDNTSCAVCKHFEPTASCNAGGGSVGGACPCWYDNPAGTNTCKYSTFNCHQTGSNPPCDLGGCSAVARTYRLCVCQW